MSHSLLLVGYGNMGRALLSGWTEAGLVQQAIVVEPAHQPHTCHPEEQPDEGSSIGHKIPRAARNDILFVNAATEIPPAFPPSMIVLAVKPQVLAEVLPSYLRFACAAPFLSIAAGKTLAFFEQHLGRETAMVRCMPNLPATVRRGVSVCCANAAATEIHRALATKLLEAVGTVHWAPEEQLDAVTALSGSGPAYLFYLAEMLAEAGARLGLDPDFATTLARETIVGAAELLRQSPEPAAVLRAQVTSKGGTTEAALKILMENDVLLSIYASAMQEAANRARDLAR